VLGCRPAVATAGLTKRGQVKASECEGAAGAAIGSVRAAATYELVVEQIRRAIFLGRFLPGDRLPAERDLASQMAVSRTTIREAIRVLEGEGLVTVRRGAAGGLVVLEQGRPSRAEIESYMAGQGDWIDHLLDYRIANECAAAALAASRRTDRHLARLAASLQEMTAICATPEARALTANVGRFFALDAAFHLTIGEASMNPLLSQAVEDTRAAMYRPIGKVFADVEAAANDHHAAILAAIADRDADAAASWMKTHIEETRAGLHRLLPRPRRTRARSVPGKA
jgi:GntR family transcriptional repressor for pyruvate dehydrogenase complex